MIIQYREKLVNKVIQDEEFNKRESQCFNVSVLGRMISSDVKSPMDVQ